MAMKILHIKWFRQVLLASIYILGVLGIVGSGGGGDDLDCAQDGFLDDCVDPPPPPPPPPSAGTTGFNATVFSIAPALDGSDDVYVGGHFSIYKNSTAKRIARLNNDGSLDAGFISGTGFDNSVSIVTPAVDGSGDVYVGGRFTDYNGSAVNYIARLNLDGTLDTDFDIGTGFDARVNKISSAADGSGDVYVGGEFTTYNGTVVGSGLVRLNDDGSLDTGFSTGSGWGEDAIAPATDGSGDVYVTRDSSPYFARLNDDGSVDAGFDTGLSGFDEVVRSIAPANDGSGDIYVAGFFGDYNGTTINGLARLNSDGSLDTGFVTDAGFVGWGNFITPTIDNSGDIFVDTNISGDIVRLNADGSIDTGFNIIIFLNDSPDSVAIATDGSNDVYVGAGFRLTNANMMRLTPAGALVR
jgi:uncharacterized delta-60 repeat protein